MFRAEADCLSPPSVPWRAPTAGPTRAGGGQQSLGTVVARCDGEQSRADGRGSHPHRQWPPLRPTPRERAPGAGGSHADSIQAVQGSRHVHHLARACPLETSCSSRGPWDAFPDATATTPPTESCVSFKAQLAVSFTKPFLLMGLFPVSFSHPCYRLSGLEFILMRWVRKES